MSDYIETLFKILPIDWAGELRLTNTGNFDRYFQTIYEIRKWLRDTGNYDHDQVRIRTLGDCFYIQVKDVELANMIILNWSGKHSTYSFSYHKNSRSD